MQLENTHIQLYRQLRLTPEDRLRLVAHWNMWRQLNESLDLSFQDAVATLSGLPQTDDVPVALLLHISQVATGNRKVQWASSDDNPSESSSSGNILPWGAHSGPSSDGAADSEAVSSQAGLGDVKAAWACEEEAELELMSRFLGGSSAVTATAERGLVQLCLVQEAHGRIRRETMELQMQPGLILSPLQHAHVMGAHVLNNSAPADLMQLCQLAAAQQRWHDVFELPPVMHKRMPGCEWLRGGCHAVRGGGVASTG